MTEGELEMPSFGVGNSPEEDKEKVIVNEGPKIGIRHVQICLLFLLLSIGYGMRVCLSVGIVAMTKKNTTSNPDVPAYDWDNKSVVLSSFYWGYICLQIIAGELANKFGPRYLLMVAMCVNSTASLIIPLVADKFGSYGVMFCRVLQGLSQGFFFPSVHNLLGQWAPLPERSFLGTIAFAGPAFGTVFAMVITGFIAASWAGWPVAFYFFGGLGFVWMLLWWFLGFNTPATHPKISKKERSYIEATLKVKEDSVVPKTPWKSIFTSLPVYAFVVGNFGQNWGYSTLLTEIPSYMDKIMKFKMDSNGILSAAPYIASFVFSFVFGWCSDSMINRGWITRQNARKLFNSIGTVIPGIALTILGFLPDGQTTLSVFMLIVAVGMNSGVFVGFQINAVDLAPRFSGILMGIGNGCSNVFSIIAPLVVQVIVTDETDKSLWRIIFIIASCIYISSDVFFVFFASGNVQPWDNPEASQEERERKHKISIASLPRISLPLS